MPEIQRQARIALRAGKCVVIGFQSTGDAAVTAALGKTNNAAAASSGPKTSGSLVSAAREVMEQLLSNLESKQNATPLGSYELSGIKRILMGKADALNLPPAALDALIEYFGVEHVAEMTGRQKAFEDG